MHKRVQTTLDVSSALLTAAGYLALVTLPEYGLVLLILVPVLLLLAPVGVLLDSRFPAYRRFTAVLTACFTLSLPFLYARLGLLSSVITVIIYVQAYLFLHRKSEREYFYLFLMALFLLLAACTESPEPAIGLVLPMFLLSAIWALMALHLRTAFAENPSSPALSLLPLNSYTTGLSGGGDLGFTAKFAATGLAMSFSGILLTTVFFAATPRLEVGMLSRPELSRATTGISDLVDLARGDAIVADTSPVMRVEFPEELGGKYNGPMYWRVTSLGSYENSVWFPSSSSPTYVKQEGWVQFWHLSSTHVRRSVFRGQPLVHQLIFVERVPNRGLPALDLVLAIKTNDFPVYWAIGSEFTVLPRTKANRGVQYEAWSEVRRPTSTQLRAAVPDIAAYQAQLKSRSYEGLIKHDLSPRAVRLARDITGPERTVYDKVQAIERWLNSGQFGYTLLLPNLSENNAVESFMFETRTGNCELYAATMALMLRSLGIPARLAIGYRGGEWDEQDRSYVVRNDMAHVWVEVFFLGYGWVLFDPSPPEEALGRTPTSYLSRLLTRYSLKAKMFWYRNVVGYNQGIQWRAVQQLGAGLVGAGFGLSSWSHGLFRGYTLGSGLLNGLILAIFAAAVCSALLSSVAWRRLAGSWRPILSPDQARAVRLYNLLRRKLTRRGASCEGKTAEELAHELRERHWVEVEPAEEIIRTYNEVRFGQRPLTRDYYVRLRRIVSALRSVAS